MLIVTLILLFHLPSEIKYLGGGREFFLFGSSKETSSQLNKKTYKWGEEMPPGSNFQLSALGREIVNNEEAIMSEGTLAIPSW